MKILIPVLLLGLVSGCSTPTPVAKTEVQADRTDRSIAAAQINVSCWKGYSQQQQDANYKVCMSGRAPDQKCETNAWKHGEGVYDVCLRKFVSPPTQVVGDCWAGTSQAEQNANQARCNSVVKDGQICETNLYKHGHGAYDVCIME